MPEVAQASGPELDRLRLACGSAIDELLAHDPQHIAVVGAGEPGRYWQRNTGGSFKRYGVDVHAGGDGDELPLGLTIGAWLLDGHGWTGSRAYATGGVNPQGRTAVLAMADGSAKRSSDAPGYFDERAAGFDRAIADALAAGDPHSLECIDTGLAQQLWCGGAVPLILLGQAIAAETSKGASVVANLRYDEAPFGVGYWVANWSLIPA